MRESPHTAFYGSSRPAITVRHSPLCGHLSANSKEEAGAQQLHNCIREKRGGIKIQTYQPISNQRGETGKRLGRSGIRDSHQQIKRAESLRTLSKLLLGQVSALGGQRESEREVCQERYECVQTTCSPCRTESSEELKSAREQRKW